MAGSPSALREMRYKIATSVPINHANAAESSWNAADGTVKKLRICAYDDSGLEQPGLDDESLETRKFARGASIPGLRTGSFTFSVYADGGYTNLAATPSQELMNAAMGGIQAATNARSTSASGSSTTVVIPFTSANTYAVAGQALLLGRKGDGKGAGEVCPISYINGTDANVSRAINAAMAAADPISVSDTTYYHDTSTQLYLEHLAIGHGTADQRQTIGGGLTFSVSGTGVGELPKLDFESMVADHQFVPVGDRTSLTHSKGPEGQDPAFDKSIGVVHLGDQSGTTRTTYRCGDIEINPQITLEQLPAPHGINGMNGWVRMPSAPIGACTILIDEDFGLVADFENQTAKQIIIQLGHQVGKCIAFEFPLAYLDALPVPADLGNLKGLRLTWHGDDTESSTDLLSSSLRIHQF